MIIPALFASLLVGNVQVAAMACSGAAPTITQAAVRSATPIGTDRTRYVVAITVVNNGGAAQPGNLLQSVDVYQDQGKIDQKGIPPLRPGQSKTVLYTFNRSSEAAAGTTRLGFRMDSPDNCGRADRVRLNV